MDLMTLALFVPAAFLLAITPGPDMLYVMTRSIAQGRSAGLVSVLGFAAGCYIHGLAAALGLSSLFAAAPLAYDILRLAGAVYLLWLAWSAIRSPSVFAGAEGTLPRAALFVVFRQAFIGNLLNPKVILFFVALFPQFVDPSKGSIILQALLLVTTLNIVGGIVNGGIAMAAGRFGRWMAARPGWQKVQRWLMATVFAGIAVRIALSGRD
ncbi:LysE family translocator [Lacibacterium aquatile]|uniref:LysE family translocator n=1 Tax=Lacibacterium aquatile TaxID=1168082 RepID=A0ABW5DPB8_9PROT